MNLVMKYVLHIKHGELRLVATYYPYDYIAWNIKIEDIEIPRSCVKKMAPTWKPCSDSHVVLSDDWKWIKEKLNGRKSAFNI